MLLEHRVCMVKMGPVFKYAWGDATRKAGLEIYNTRHRFLKQCECEELATAWRYLCNNQLQDDTEEHVVELRKLYSQKLFDKIHLHTQVPQYLGEGRTTLIDKVSAHVHSTLLEMGSVPALTEALENLVVWVSDMGVEAGIPNSVVETPESVLPSFLRPSRLQVSSEDGDFCEEEPGLGLCAAKPEALMPKALHLPGFCHAVHNCTQNLNSALAKFDRFLEQLRVVHKLLSSPMRRSRFVEVVLQGTPVYAVGKELFHRFSRALYEERWGEIATYLKKARPLYVFLKLYWDEVAFVRRDANAVAQAEQESAED